MVPEFLAGFEPGASQPAGWSFVDSGRFLAHGDRPSLDWRHRVHVGHSLRFVAEAAFVFSHRIAYRAAFGFVRPRLRSPGLATANSNHGSRAHLLAVSASTAQHELRVSGSLAAPRVGTCTVASRDYPRGMHSDFLLADASCFPESFSSSSKHLNEASWGGLHR